MLHWFSPLDLVSNWLTNILWFCLNLLIFWRSGVLCRFIVLRDRIDTLHCSNHLIITIKLRLTLFLWEWLALSHKSSTHIWISYVFSSIKLIFVSDSPFLWLTLKLLSNISSNPNRFSLWVQLDLQFLLILTNTGYIILGPFEYISPSSRPVTDRRLVTKLSKLRLRRLANIRIREFIGKLGISFWNFYLFCWVIVIWYLVLNVEGLSLKYRFVSFIWFRIELNSISPS